MRTKLGWSTDPKRHGALQLTVRKALELLGDEAVASIAKEIGQLVERGTFAPVDDRELTPEQARMIISSSLFLKEKFSPTGIFEKLKSRLVAGGHMQDRSLYPDKDSPTAATASVFMVAGIAASEGRAVATVDFPGAYLHSDLPPDQPPVLMRLNKYEAQVLVKIAPEYAKHLRKNGTLVVRLRKGLYGLVQAARLWYDKISADLIKLGFQCNAMDCCVFNRSEDSTQTTIVLHVDDMLITTGSEAHIDRLLQQLSQQYPDLTVHRGRQLDYLGMHLNWETAGKCYVTMPAYVDDVLTFGANIKGVSKTPAAESLFTVTPDSPVLNSAEREFYHSLTAKLLYLAKRSRPDLLLAVSFLARRVQQPTDEDRVKLYRVLKYLRATREVGICLEPDKILQAYGYVDASFAVHSDFKSHTGCVIGLGKGPFWTKSSVQKLNSKSSTEAELIGAADSSSQLLWTRQFLQEQGYNVGPAILYQDNQSTMALIKNGRSNSERTRHIAIKYFFIKDRVDKKEIAVEYLSTGEMIADILTKPLQGEQFLRLRALLLNWP
jgi:hypothetical protein